jgi:hypothetical protein
MPSTLPRNSKGRFVKRSSRGAKRRSSRRRNTTGKPFSSKVGIYRPRFKVAGFSAERKAGLRDSMKYARKHANKRRRAKSYRRPRRSNRPRRNLPKGWAVSRAAFTKSRHRFKRGWGKAGHYRKRRSRKNPVFYNRGGRRRYNRRRNPLGGGLVNKIVSGLKDFLKVGTWTEAGLGAVGLAGAYALPAKLAGMHPSLAKLNQGWGGVAGSALSTVLLSTAAGMASPRLAGAVRTGGLIATAIRALAMLVPAQSHYFQPPVEMLAMGPARSGGGVVKGMLGLDAEYISSRDLINAETGHVGDYVPIRGDDDMGDYMDLPTSGGAVPSGERFS